MARKYKKTISIAQWRVRMAGYPQQGTRQVREAFSLMMRRVEETGAHLLPGTPREGMDRFVAPVLALAEQWKSWRRPACSWVPESRQPTEQFSELARHLLADYPIPRFMDSVFLLPEWGRFSHWFVHLGAGRSIRTVPDLTAALTSKMAHYMLLAPPSCTVIQALRLGQVLGLGGKAAVAREVSGTRLGLGLQSKEDEAFWLTVLQWLVNHPELPRSQIIPLFDFVGRRRARDPEFSMKGRSVAALLRLIREWHEELSRAPQVEFHVLPASGVAPPFWEAVDEAGWKWRITELGDTYALHAEGEAMNHCVYSYAQWVLCRECSIWSLKVGSGIEVERAVTIEVRNRQRKVVQARGKSNRLPTAAERQLLSRWAREHALELSL